jgi:hypothetical protein
VILNNNDEVSIATTTDNEIQIKQEFPTDDEDSDIDNNNERNVPSYRRYCTICSRSTANDPNIIITTVPNVNPEWETSPSIRHRKLFGKLSARREKYCSRLRLLEDQQKKKYIYICDSHEQHNELMNVHYNDLQNQSKTYQMYLQVPIDPNKINITRSSSKKSKPYVPRKSTCSGNKTRRKKQTVSYRSCGFCRCKNNGKLRGITFHRIQPPIKPDNIYNNNNTTKDDDGLESMAIKKKYRELCLLSMGRSINDPKKDIRICNKHETIQQQVLVHWIDEEGNANTKSVTMNIPSAQLQPSTRESIERNQRLNNREISQSQQAAMQGDQEAAVKYFELLNNRNNKNNKIGIVRRKKM